MKTNIYFWSHLAKLVLEWEIFQAKVVEEIKKHVFYSVTFFFRKSCCLWDNMEKYYRLEQATYGSIIWRMGIACRITKARDTHSQYVILIVFPLQQWLRERGSMICYTHIACLVCSAVFWFTISRCLEGANQLSVAHTASLFTVGENSYSTARLSKVISQKTKRLYTYANTSNAVFTNLSFLCYNFKALHEDRNLQLYKLTVGSGVA